MKIYILPLLLMCALFTNAQTTTKPQLDDKATVKDGNGNLVPAIIWRAYYKTGDYSFRYVKTDNSYLIYQMSTEEKALADQRKDAVLANSSRPRPSQAFKDGEKFKGEKFTDINGIKYDLKQLTGKVLVFNFWFINCPPCRQEIPELNQLFTKYKDHKDIVFLAIALDEKYDIKQFLKTSPFLYNIVSDGRFYTGKYGVSSYPTHLVVGKDGLVKFHTMGLAHNTVYWVEKTLKDQIAL